MSENIQLNEPHFDAKDDVFPRACLSSGRRDALSTHAVRGIVGSTRNIDDEKIKYFAFYGDTLLDHRLAQLSKFSNISQNGNACIFVIIKAVNRNCP